jgi:hypothetical protein
VKTLTTEIKLSFSWKFKVGTFYKKDQSCLQRQDRTPLDMTCWILIIHVDAEPNVSKIFLAFNKVLHTSQKSTLTLKFGISSDHQTPIPYLFAHKYSMIRK